MKTWQSVLLNLALVFGASFVPQIKNPALQKSVYAIIGIVGAGAAKVNSESDQNGNKLPPTT